MAGGTWAALFVVPALAAQAPRALEQELVGVVVGYIALYVVFALGWAWTGLTLIRAGLVPTWLGVLTVVAAALAFMPSPEPIPLLLIGVAATFLARRLTTTGATPHRTSQPA